MPATMNNPYTDHKVRPSGNPKEWVTQAKCRNGDPDALFVQGAAQRRAAKICRRCPVLMECRVDSLEHKVEFGVWGGLTERQRRALLRQNPLVTNWAEFLRDNDELLEFA